MSFDYSKNVDHPYNTMSRSITTTTTSSCSEDETMNSSTDGPDGFRKGPWTVEEDIALVNYIAVNGEGRWNSLASCAGLKRTGKSCRLRWLNYLRPDVRRGNITPEEQLLILELHSRWGNRWSKIAQYLPGRTDNEIKNYWRTRVQKQAKQLKCDVNSQQFKDTLRYLWIPRLVEKIKSSASASDSSIATAASLPLTTTNATSSSTTFNHHLGEGDFHPQQQQQQQQQQYGHHAQNTNNNWQLSAAVPLGSSTVPSSNNYSVDVTASDNSSISTDSMGNYQLVHSPVSTGGSGGGQDYYSPYPYPTTCTSSTGIDGAETAASLYGFQGGADHQNMNPYAAVDSVMNPSSVSNYFNQYNLTGGLEFDYQGLDGDYHKLNDVDISLWNAVEDVNSYDHLLHQPFCASNQISPTSSTFYF